MCHNNEQGQKSIIHLVAVSYTFSLRPPNLFNPENIDYHQILTFRPFMAICTTVSGSSIAIFVCVFSSIILYLIQCSDDKYDIVLKLIRVPFMVQIVRFLRGILTCVGIQLRTKNTAASSPISVPPFFFGLFGMKTCQHEVLDDVFQPRIIPQIETLSLFSC